MRASGDPLNGVDSGWLDYFGMSSVVVVGSSGFRAGLTSILSWLYTLYPRHEVLEYTGARIVLACPSKYARHALCTCTATLRCVHGYPPHAIPTHRSPSFHSKVRSLCVITYQPFARCDPAVHESARYD